MINVDEKLQALMTLKLGFYAWAVWPGMGMKS